MADKLLRAQVTIPMDDALPEDYCTNTWYFDGDDGNTDASHFSSLATLLTDFYQAIDSDVYPTQVSDPFTVNVYDMRDPQPRVPVYQFDIPIVTSGTDMLPAEVAICLSFQAEAVSGGNQRRRRGRVFLGPLKNTVVAISGAQARPSSTVRNSIATAAAALENGLAEATTGSMKWAVYSPTTDASDSVDNAFNDVVDGWIDDAFDTQRRRGCKASARTSWT